MEVNRSFLSGVQVRDLSTYVKTLPIRGTIDLPVLDLSAKRGNSLVHTSNVVANLKTDNKHTTEMIDSGRRSPFEGRTFMVTPPYDSPKKKRNREPIYKYSDRIEQQESPSSLPINLQMSVSTMPAMYPTSNETISRVPLIGTSIISTPSVTSATETSTESNKKTPRPFKAYPNNPLCLNMGSPELLPDQSSQASESYSQFRKRVLESVKRSTPTNNNKMRRLNRSPGLPTSTDDEKDAAYWERRRKNNEAAKRSRDARRAKEDEIAIRAAYLEQENLKLKYELIALRNETAKLRCLMYST